jgi:hypothetical protein
MLPSINLSHCMLCDGCWDEMKAKMAEFGVQPHDSDATVLQKLLLTAQMDGMEAYVTEFGDKSTNLLTLANNLPCRFNPACQGYCWVRLVSTRIPTTAVSMITNGSGLPYEAGAIEYWYADTYPTSQYDPRLAKKSDFSCTAIACTVRVFRQQFTLEDAIRSTSFTDIPLCKPCR